MVSFAEALAERLQDKLVEIYLGDSYEEVNYADNAKTTNSVLVGKVVEALGDCLVINARYANKQKEIVFGNIIYVNAYNINAICELDGSGTLRDAFYSTDETPTLQPGGKHGRR